VASFRKLQEEEGMAESQKLIQSYQSTHWLIHKQAEDLTHEESVMQLPFRGNCFNWVVGHIIVSRNRVLTLLDEPSLFSDEETAVYDTGSDPITQSETAIPFDSLLEILDETQERIIAILSEIPEERLAEIYDEERGTTIGDRIAGLHWHETYHTGQLEILRQLAGKNDRIIG
jgi:uncharacterized damage-inducible protein DinB